MSKKQLIGALLNPFVLVMEIMFLLLFRERFSQFFPPSYPLSSEKLFFLSYYSQLIGKSSLWRGILRFEAKDFLFRHK